MAMVIGESHEPVLICFFVIIFGVIHLLEFTRITQEIIQQTQRKYKLL